MASKKKDNSIHGDDREVAIPDVPQSIQPTDEKFKLPEELLKMEDNVRVNRHQERIEFALDDATIESMTTDDWARLLTERGTGNTILHLDRLCQLTRQKLPSRPSLSRFKRYKKGLAELASVNALIEFMAALPAIASAGFRIEEDRPGDRYTLKSLRKDDCENN